MDIMDINSNIGSPILADSALMNNSPRAIHTARLPYSTNSPTFNSSLLKVPRMIPEILDDVMSSGWLEAMKSSSPPHSELTRNFGSELTPTDADIAYKNWLLKYPLVLSSFEQITNSAKGKRLALFLDYDGTLSPIVDNPDKAFMSSAVFRSLVENTKDIDGTIVENNTVLRPLFTTVIFGQLLCESVTEVLKHYPCLRLTHGRKVPSSNIDVAYNVGLSDSDDVLPIYIGDDHTDEDAFKVLREMNHGFGILVSSAPKDSSALYSLKDPSDVMKFLKKLVLWKKNISKP
ncbi:hypothetical protein Leryth_009837 [Lithospermum erythrorhizon]|nr:hypothetical protein Leryth_009837 [Lithospermum erythrorhizon]